MTAPHTSVLDGTELGYTLDRLASLGDPDLNLIVTALRNLATRTLTLNDSQVIGTALIGDADSEDLVAAVGLLHAHLHDPKTNPALAPLPFDAQDEARQYGKATAHELTHHTLRNNPARACAALDIRSAYTGQCSVCGGEFEGWNGGVCQACQASDLG